MEYPRRYWWLEKLVERVVGLPGLEPGTSSLSEKRSNRLSYRPVNGTTKRTAEIGYNTGRPLTS
jgi:hypothetical protein